MYNKQKLIETLTGILALMPEQLSTKGHEQKNKIENNLNQIKNKNKKPQSNKERSYE